jgi:allene oxide cyclase
MKIRLALVALAAAAAAALFAVRTQASPKNVLALVERAETDAVTDTGAKDDSAGDLLTFANPMFDAKNEKQVGTDQGFCVRTVPGKAWECWWTLSLADGQITVQGPFLDKGDSVLAITGGTGKYAQARGQMKLHARDEKGSAYDFVYDLR